ncbi:hypothetical protein NFHSH190041_23520 [Shewanella sp. NFH-SH190041]|uniref:hypothetical protein n=1 Tax=Shewanella sp. NFH-SH190041 TaxID=2950245 RepID=UPI0021C374F4|nr:hypothetical protein [Shewanella sp. NFH-SH190041]BDM64900.1 hypothetical protein NFHSH190041_23520 [Shewanella sp. NFH-SH190041]
MNIEQLIRSYCSQGGAWDYLYTQLLLAGCSANLAQLFIEKFSKTLGKDNADLALGIFQEWQRSTDERTIEVMLKIIPMPK